MSPQQASGRRLTRRIAAEVRPFTPQIGLVLLLELLAAPLLLLMPIPLKIAVDSVIGSDPLPGFLDRLAPDAFTSTALRLLLLAAVLQVVVVLLAQLRELGSYVVQTRTGEAMTLRFRSRLFEQAQRLSFSFHDTRGTADSIYRIQTDAPAIQYVTVYGVIPLLAAVVALASMIVVTVRLDAGLAVIALAISPVIYGLSHGYKVRMRRRYREVKELETNALQVVQEVLTSIRVVKAFGAEAREQDRFVSRSAEGMRARVRISFAEGVLGLLLSLVTAVGTAAVIFVGVRNVQAGTLTLGELLMVVAYLSMLYGPLKTIGLKLASLQSSVASCQRAFELLDEVPEVDERPGARAIDRAAGAIELREVSFAYRAGTPALQDVTLRVPAGTSVAVAGRTGAGKTTLASLITRFYDPVSGAVLLDGVDLRDYRLADLREQFGIVLQEPVLFATSVAENIAYARPGAGAEEVVEAARAAGAHDFIEALPEGYETLVGERGMRLSGGERQRISLARAFLKDAPVLILDEPTSSVDTETEASIMEAMRRLMQGRTTFMIAHRLSTLEHCDLLVVLDHGQVVTATGDVAGAIRRGLVMDRDGEVGAGDVGAGVGADEVVVDLRDAEAPVLTTGPVPSGARPGPPVDLILPALARGLADPDEGVRDRARSALRAADRELVSAWAARSLSEGAPTLGAALVAGAIPLPSLARAVLEGQADEPAQVAVLEAFASDDASAVELATLALDRGEVPVRMAAIDLLGRCVIAAGSAKPGGGTGRATGVEAWARD